MNQINSRFFTPGVWRAVLGVTALALAGGAAPAAPTGAEGTWLDQSGKAGIAIAPCGDALCGRIVWLRAPLDDAGHPKTDIHNDDASLRPRPLCGLPLLQGFHPDDPGEWSGGTIYDPESGTTYQAKMRLQDDGTLKVRGFVGISLLGRSQVWTRPPAPLPLCK